METRRSEEQEGDVLCVAPERDEGRRRRELGGENEQPVGGVRPADGEAERRVDESRSKRDVAAGERKVRNHFAKGGHDAPHERADEAEGEQHAERTGHRHCDSSKSAKTLEARERAQREA